MNKDKDDIFLARNNTYKKTVRETSLKLLKENICQPGNTDVCVCVYVCACVLKKCSFQQKENATGQKQIYMCKIFY
jgi:hypothetical protein